MTTTVAQAAVKFANMAAALQQAPRTVLPGVALVVKREMLSVITPATGGDLRLSGVGRNGARVGVGYQIAGDQALVSARGPLHFLERDVKPHDVTIKGTRRGPRALAGRGLPHPVHSARKAGGMHARRVWTRSEERAATIAGPEFARKMSAAMVNAYRKG